MRVVAALSLLLLLTACRGTQPYATQDLRQVRRAYAQIRPTYTAFEQAYRVGNTTGILTYFRQEQQECKLVDVIDKRDTIDPNINLFFASAALDDMCNAIESAYVTWAPKHGFPYDKSVLPSRPSDVFLGPDLDLTKMSGYLRNPASLA